ncbi:MAG: lysophospholipid acyltransferase family protein [Planctomycetota bacterium]
MVNPSAKPAAVARYSPWLAGWFRWYIRGYLRKHFHAVAICREGRPAVAEGERLVFYLNHAGWWDPLIAQFVAERFFPGRVVYAPFDAEAIARYPLFERLGFFGVDQASRRGAAEFLRTAGAVLGEPAGSLWMTPEGRFCDPRDAAAEFEPGLAHLACKLAGDGGRPAVLTPLAIEYPFWEERSPEALVRFGAPVRAAEFGEYTKQQMGALLRGRLTDAQAELARLSIARDGAAFEVLLGGAGGVGGVYDAFRRFKSRLAGAEHQTTHGQKLQT